MAVFKVIERSLSFVSIIILARVLVPADFGIVAMAMTLVVAMDLFIQFGFDVILKSAGHLCGYAGRVEPIWDLLGS